MSFFHKRNPRGELPIPGPATTDPKALEIARIWAANREQVVSLRAGIWSDPSMWGLMLADLARHVSRSYVQEDPTLDAAKILSRIKAGFEAEMATNTDPKPD
jgi:hypothetical protein